MHGTLFCESDKPVAAAVTAAARYIKNDKLG